ncbi:MAG TPA: tripartite tricarboxylate transporter substrate binding protein [Xanthobacteraceae bacterium]|jgi:tripartite-type tricarboxylate transporter receptor subunit TctC
MLTRRELFTAAAALGLCHVGHRRAYAQVYPGKPIKLIVPYSAGSPNDVLARLVAPYLSARLREAVVVETRPGGGTTIGARAVMLAEPDGHTLLFTNTPTHAIAPLIGKGGAFDPLNDFAAVGPIASSFLVMVVAPNVPASTMAELVSHAKAHPGTLNFGFGQGTFPQLVGEAFKLETATEIASIPYKGGAQAITDVLGGRIQLNFGTLATLLPLIRAGKLKPLAVTAAVRASELPEVPTMLECGLPNLTTATFYGLMAAAGTAPAIVERLNREINPSLASPELAASMAKLGFQPTGGTPQEFASLIAEHMRKWAPIVNAVAFQLE